MLYRNAIEPSGFTPSVLNLYVSEALSLDCFFWGETCGSSFVVRGCLNVTTSGNFQEIEVRFVDVETASCAHSVAVTMNKNRRTQRGEGSNA